MRILTACIFVLVTICAGSIFIWKVVQQKQIAAATLDSDWKNWNPAAARAYLDTREIWWQNWPSAQMDHGTVCISCHTVVPYALVRPTLRKQLGEKEQAAPETIMLASVEKRVSNWAQIAPFYTDAANGPGKTAQSRATEAVLNAVILSTYDAMRVQLSPIARTAFDEAWALQEKAGENAGSWNWQDFHLAPWESPESRYQGAALMAVALGNAPGQYVAEPQVREHLARLQGYLRRHYATQPLMSQIYVMWASARMSGLLAQADRTELTKKIADLQLRDGGWTLSSLDQQPGIRRHLLDYWRQISDTVESDGCATGLVVLALEENGVKPSDAVLNRGVHWLEQHQAKNGSWRASSLNGFHDFDSDIGQFMSDAATAYAALALENARREPPNSIPH